jgi:hypothetical protein
MFFRKKPKFDQEELHFIVISAKKTLDEILDRMLHEELDDLTRRLLNDESLRLMRLIRKCNGVV